MHKILQNLLNDENISDVADFFSHKKEFLIYGLSGSQKVATMAAMFAKNPRPTILVVESREKISEWQSDLSEFLPSVEIEELPELDLINVRADTVGIERRAKRLELLMRMLRGENLIVLATPAAIVKKDFSRKDFLNNQITIEVGENLQLGKLIKQLVNFDYERTDEIDAPGKFSVRGEIVDIFPINSARPLRSSSP